MCGRAFDLRHLRRVRRQHLLVPAEHHLPSDGGDEARVRVLPEALAHLFEAGGLERGHAVEDLLGRQLSRGERRGVEREREMLGTGGHRAEPLRRLRHARKHLLARATLDGPLRRVRHEARVRMFEQAGRGLGEAKLLEGRRVRAAVGVVEEAELRAREEAVLEGGVHLGHLQRGVWRLLRLARARPARGLRGLWGLRGRTRASAGGLADDVGGVHLLLTHAAHHAEVLHHRHPALIRMHEVRGKHLREAKLGELRVHARRRQVRVQPLRSDRAKAAHRRHRQRSEIHRLAGEHLARHAALEASLVHHHPAFVLGVLVLVRAHRLEAQLGGSLLQPGAVPMPDEGDARSRHRAVLEARADGVLLVQVDGHVLLSRISSDRRRAAGLHPALPLAREGPHRVVVGAVSVREAREAPLLELARATLTTRPPACW